MMKQTSPLMIIYPWCRGDNTLSRVDQKLSISTSQRMIMMNAVRVMFYLLCKIATLRGGFYNGRTVVSFFCSEQHSDVDDAVTTV